MPGAARLGDTAGGHGCFPPTAVTSASAGVMINGKPAARVGRVSIHIRGGSEGWNTTLRYGFSR
ncbi:PAAR domain-containing protein [Salinivibrio costicola]|uniref:Uncharacterized protein n=1 Tax=Salinivibrio costicola subsp. alcaliphilus TaxID=272773 RepID=A0ABX3KSN6_SALCS|nr:hypothetical protein [Salinivibrio costicola]OOF34600.1 hypothetical protein BZJ21_04415 [Salinivibrio costicola subsp. alcaliphilus]